MIRFTAFLTANSSTERAFTDNLLSLNRYVSATLF